MFDRRKDKTTVSFEELLTDIDKHFNKQEKRKKHCKVQPSNIHKHIPTTLGM